MSPSMYTMGCAAPRLLSFLHTDALTAMTPLKRVTLVMDVT